VYFRRYDLGQANTQTDTLITILRSPIVGGVTTITVTVSLPVNAVMFQFHDFTCIPTPILYRPANFSWRNIALLQFLRRWPSAVVVHKLFFKRISFCAIHSVLVRCAAADLFARSFLSVGRLHGGGSIASAAMRPVRRPLLDDVKSSGCFH